MAIRVVNREAEALTEAFAEMIGVGVTKAIVVAMREAIEHRRGGETAARLRQKHGIVLDDAMREPLPREAFDEEWGGGRAAGCRTDRCIALDNGGA